MGRGGCQSPEPDCKSACFQHSQSKVFEFKATSSPDHTMLTPGSKLINELPHNVVVNGITRTTEFNNVIPTTTSANDNNRQQQQQDLGVLYDLMRFSPPIMPLATIRDDNKKDEIYTPLTELNDIIQPSYHLSPNHSAVGSPPLWNVCASQVYSPMLTASGHLAYSPLMRVQSNNATAPGGFSLDGPVFIPPSPHSPGSMGWMIPPHQVVLNTGGVRYEAAMTSNEDIPRDIRRSLVVSFIPQCWTLQKLRDVFAPYGTVLQYRLDENPDGTGHRGRGFIELDSPEAAIAAMIALNGLAVEESKRLKVLPKWISSNRSSNRHNEQNKNSSGQKQRQEKKCNLENSIITVIPKQETGDDGIQQNDQISSQGGVFSSSSEKNNNNNINNNNNNIDNKFGTSQQQRNVSVPIIPQHNLFIFHIPPNWNEAELRRQFESFGRIRSLGFPKDDTTPWGHKGYGFICYENLEDAQHAIRKMDGKEVQTGRRLKVELKKPSGRSKNHSRKDSRTNGTYKRSENSSSDYPRILGQCGYKQNESRFSNLGSTVDSLLWTTPPDYPIQHRDWVPWPVQLRYQEPIVTAIDAGGTLQNNAAA